MSLDTHAVTNIDDLHRLLGEDRIGTDVTLGVLRGGERLDFRVRVANRQR